MLTYLSIYSWGVITAFVLISVLNHLWLYDIHKNPDFSEVLFLSILSWIGVGIIIVVSLMILFEYIQYKTDLTDNKIIKKLKKLTGVEK
jgi:magnesium-transporting ATPase (P-type)